MKRLVPILALIALCSACSPSQARLWRAWHKEEPKAAVEWAVNECGALCTDDWDHDGIVEPEPAEPEPAAEPEPSDDSSSSTDNGSGGGGYGACAEWYSTAMAAGWDDSQWSTLDAIMWRESNCQSSAYNSSGASGLLQLMPLHLGSTCGYGDLFNPWFNLSCAHELYEAAGWSPWSL